MVKIQVKNFSFRYPRAENHALKDLSLSIREGEFVTIFGPSGCGKTTLLRHMKSVLAPFGEVTGEIFFSGKALSEITEKEQSQTIGFVMQDPSSQIVTDKVWHELAFGLESLGVKTTEIRARVSEMAAFFGIEPWFYQDVNTLSGGQKQLLNLASVMVMNPSLLILDEPTAQLDPIAASDFLEAVKKINRELGVTVILTEHRLEEAFPMSDRVVMMDEGKIIASGTPSEVGEFLAKENHPMTAGLPTPMRLYSKIENSLSCPVTVREGRAWLAEMKKAYPTRELFSEEPSPYSEKLLEVKEVFFRYEKEEGDVLKNLNLTVYEGEFLAILGGNGAGKSTALSLLSGLKKPNRGTVEWYQKKKIGFLPQNPTILFLKKTVEEDLLDICGERNEAFYEVLSLTNISHLTHRHPYDLSGGEQERVALAKVLLEKPDVLLLDEPTKGLDAAFKEEFASILMTLKDQGTTIIMVSHDVEFCARFADRTALFFDGAITSVGTPREFFSKNSFYTTAASRMSRSILEGCVTAEDILYSFGQEIKREKKTPKKKNPPSIGEEKKEKKKKNPYLVGLGTLFLIFGIWMMFYFGNEVEVNLYLQGGILASFSIGLLSIFGSEELVPREKFETEKEKRHLGKRTLLALFMVVFLIPLTIFVGHSFLGDRKYYFISLLLLLEILAPFMLIYEDRKPKPRELVTISVLCALAIASRILFAPVPQFKPVLALIIVSGVAFGGEVGFLVGAVTAFLSNMYFGQGPWTPWQMFAMGAIGFLGGLLFKKGLLRSTRGALSVFGFLTTIGIYGVLMDTSTALLNLGTPTWEGIFASLSLGFPMNLIHGISTVFFLWFAGGVMIEKLDRIKTKYGLNE